MTIDKTSIICSTIIPTIGRPTLSRAVESVLKQSIPGEGFEVVVVNDSGVPLPESDWQRSERVQIINTNRRERSVARNTGAAIAKGKYLHFLDDDDWAHPGAYQHMLDLSRSSSAKWLYGMTQLVDRQDHPLIKLKHELHGNCFVQAMAGEWIPLQSSWIDRKTFMHIGGFNPLLAGPEDIDLLRRILLAEEVAETPNLIARVVMGGEGSTTDYVHHPQASRAAREIILDTPGAYARMHVSAVNAFWKGRMLRIYLTSTVWNLKHRHFFTLISRIFSSVVSTLQAWTTLFSSAFWQAVRKPYASVTFEKGFQEIQRAK
ncbi:MAG: glycosyltransferase family 2 protein [Chloroflexota bacterium]|nr:glycosyltransferase family 2 protein [Chloroflexota bacterium]